MGIGIALGARGELLQELVLSAVLVHLCRQALVLEIGRRRLVFQAVGRTPIWIQGTVRRQDPRERQRNRVRNPPRNRLPVSAGERAVGYSRYCRTDVHVRLRFLEVEGKSASVRRVVAVFA